MIRHDKPLLAGAVILGSLALVPGLPKLPFVLLSIGLLVMRRGQKQDGTGEPETPEDTQQTEAERMEAQFQEFLEVDNACIEIGVRLIPLVDDRKEKGLVSRIKEMRVDLAKKHGIWVPPVRVRDSLRIDPSSYRVILNGREVTSAVIHPDRFLAIDPGTSTASIEGEQTNRSRFRSAGGMDRERSEVTGNSSRLHGC